MLHRPLSHDTPVLVAGAGIAGMSAAMHLAHLGFPVLLLDAAPTIGGSMHLLDHTFPTDSCGLCLMLPQQPAFCPTFECERQPNLTLLPYAELLDLADNAGASDDPGGPGALTAIIRHKPRFVDPEACTGCGDCALVCPESRPHDLEGDLAPVKAIFRPPGLRAVPDTWLIDMDVCTRCGACVQACPTGAIDLDMQPQLESRQVAALLLAPGFAPFDARLKGEFGYQVYDNVLSATQFERMVSLAGSSVAHLARPSDGQPPRRIAFVHCIGSRDIRPLGPGQPSTGHCSSACCMFTAKQVALAKKIDPDLLVTVFHMDLRAFGKDFDAYLDRVRALPGVTYRRAMPSSVHQLQQSHNLAVTYADGDALHQEQFDLLVLANGFAPPQGMQHLAHTLGLDLNEFGFARTDPYQPTHTARPGLFVAGAFREPKDIPDTVTEAAAAAAEVAAFLQGSIQPPVDRPGSAHSPRNVSDEEPRVGVFVCDCHGELAPLAPAQLAAWAQELPGVLGSQVAADGCSAEGQAAILAAIGEYGFNRIVLAGCSHRLFTAEFEALMRQAGLDPRLLARVNLRDQVLLPHRHNGADLAAKARSLLAMAVANLKSMSGLENLVPADSTPLVRRALVLGGSAAGLTAALELAALDIPVHLVERQATLGGQWRHIRYQPADLFDPAAPAPQAALEDLIAQVHAQARIQIHLGAELASFQGQPGQYRALIAANDAEESLEVGALVVATGGVPATTSEYLYGQDPRVLTQRQLEQQIADGTLATVQSVVMIQCAGSRQPERPYCSRICCTQAIKNALMLKQLQPQGRNLDLYVLYRDLRTFGFREAYYQDARDAGVVFLRYDLDQPQGAGKPTVQAEEDYLLVQLLEPVTRQQVHLKADLLILSTGIDARTEQPLADSLGLALNPDGFFLEQHAKMMPLDLQTADGNAAGGIFVAGLAHSPRFLEETIIQAQAAAIRAAAFLAPGALPERPTSVWVNPRLCSFCGLCVEACPYGARVMNHDTRVADVDPALCHGCGLCAVACPNKATLQKAFQHKQFLSSIDMAFD